MRSWTCQSVIGRRCHLCRRVEQWLRGWHCAEQSTWLEVWARTGCRSRPSRASPRRAAPGSSSRPSGAGGRDAPRRPRRTGSLSLAASAPAGDTSQASSACTVATAGGGHPHPCRRRSCPVQLHRAGGGSTSAVAGAAPNHSPARTASLPGRCPGRACLPCPQSEPFARLWRWPARSTSLVDAWSVRRQRASRNGSTLRLSSGRRSPRCRWRAPVAWHWPHGGEGPGVLSDPECS
mmetsp:Transcript_86873/g.274252  ORF Transcript_86873/g.274252 Transcript_86873/m.274252 type:complete len:235 (-) Transcript_86873:26-730(-)